jgi:Sulfotransferase domain
MIRMNDGEAPLPNFLIIGAQKSGTRWLRHNLGCHRSIFVVDHEVEFFNHNYESGTDWYRAQFGGWNGQPVVGEATPGYMFHFDAPDAVAQRIEETLGSDVAIIALLRDPVERARSSYEHHLRRGRIDPDADPISYIESLDPETDSLGIVSGGWYGRSLEAFAARFDRLLVEFHADIASAGEDLFVRALQHLGIDDPWVPADFHDVRHSGIAQMQRKFADHPILSISDAELRSVIGRSYDDDAELLEKVIGRAVPWSLVS